MEPNNPSRRGWLGGMLAGAVGFLRPGKAEPAAPPAPPVPEARPDEGVVIITTYDFEGRLISTRKERRPRQGRRVVCDASGRVVATIDP